MLELLFQNDATGTTIAAIGSGFRNTVTAGSLYMSLHTGDPSAGNQTTSEATYTDYARVTLNRTSGVWQVSSNVASNIADIEWPTASGGSNTITYVAVGTDVSGAGNLIYVHQLSASLAVSTGITPRFVAGDLTFTET
jgi:hypothetical protein